ncbi:MAG: metallophosphoesterase [Myxococcales bacterium]|nr:metallophosphoesterase [Myxococcales bacterium]
MSTIVQLSDIHLLGAVQEQAPIFDGLVEALAKTRARTGRQCDVLAITGDVVDTVSADPYRVEAALVSLLDRLDQALGGPAPTIIVPGNHDRRRMGLLGPHRDDLFEHLAKALRGRVYVHGTETPFLSAVVPPVLHRQPMSVIAYDSTYLPRGLVSAGGVLRQEDLLHAASRIAHTPTDWPVLFLQHHHLVPTPLTDVGHIEASHRPAAMRWIIQHVLPSLVANADREELTMTALGAGTALSTLHSLQRAVLVLHGHKHYATARLLKGTGREQGDVMLVSAGSCGIAQPWRPTGTNNTARLWPSFNWVEIDADRLLVQMVSFGWKGTSAGHVVCRPLVQARREGACWYTEPLPSVVEEIAEPILESNQAHFWLEPSVRAEGRRWDSRCVRRVRVRPSTNTRPSRYVETLEGLDGAEVWVEGLAKKLVLPADVALSFDQHTAYAVAAGIPRTLEEGRRCLGVRSAPFASVALMNRYRAEEVVLMLEGLGDEASEAFASQTDLGTGLEQPAWLEPVSGPGRVCLKKRGCPARTLLRIYWPLLR